MTPVTFLLPDMIGKSYAVNIIDAPGHVNFFDEAIAAMYLCDGVIIVVDAAEGVMSGTILAIKHALSQQLAITLVISKVDRLILELRLPPVDAYHKLKYIIDEFNEVVAANTTGRRVRHEIAQNRPHTLLHTLVHTLLPSSPPFIPPTSTLSLYAHSATIPDPFMNDCTTPSELLLSPEHGILLLLTYNLLRSWAAVI